MRLFALLGLVLALATGCSFGATSGDEPAGKCEVVGYRDLRADDPLCITPSVRPGDPTSRRAGAAERTVTYFNHDTPMPSWLLSATPAPIKEYPHVHIEVYRYNDGNDRVVIDVSETCRVELWDYGQMNLGCLRSGPAHYRPLTREEATVLLSLPVVEGLEANAAAQGGRVAQWRVSIVTPDPDPLD